MTYPILDCPHEIDYNEHHYVIDPEWVREAMQKPAFKCFSCRKRYPTKGLKNLYLGLYQGQTRLLCEPCAQAYPNVSSYTMQKQGSS